jgi:hypothetical protein
MDMIVIAVCGVIFGVDNWVDIEEFGYAKYEWLRQFGRGRSSERQPQRPSGFDSSR